MPDSPSSCSSPGEVEAALHPSTVEVVRELRARYPQTPFLTLGQTVLWDEPTKAAFCRILETVAPDATMMAAVHDTDYFAKLPNPEAALQTDQKFVLLPHNDGDTRGLWSAAGELSCLFGGETVTGRGLLTQNGVAWDRVAKHYPGGERALANQETAAWGWRAIVHTEDAPLIAADVRLQDIAPALKEQLAWGFEESLKSLPQSTLMTSCDDGCAACARDANEVAQKISDWVDEFIRDNSAATLSDLYRWLTPRLWCLVRGGGTCNLQTSTSMELFRFNSETATRPRFHFVDVFLNPQTREAANRAYNEAVQGSGIYTLDQLGVGALPLDVVIPGKGRGTLRLDNGSLYIDTTPAITLCLGCNCGSVQELADLLERQFGPDVALVGKAVALISMLSAEFIFVFHEKASSYTSRTQEMNRLMREAGITLELHPLLRLQYATWNSLQNVQTPLRLPSHLASAFGENEIVAGEFATRWETVCDAQDALREQLKAQHSPRDLLAFAAGQWNGDWSRHAQNYEATRKVLLEVRERTQVLENEIADLQQTAREATQQANQIERTKGEDFRARVQPLRERLFDIKEAASARLNPVDEEGKPRRLTKEERQHQNTLEAQEAAEIAQLRAQIDALQTERARFDVEIGEQRRQAFEARSAAKAKTAERVALEKGESTSAARRDVARIEYEAELERLRRVRDAIRVSSGLRYTNYRPTAWWFPLVSPDGAWFRSLAQSAQARLEEL